MLAPFCVVSSTLWTTGERESIDGELDTLLLTGSVNIGDRFVNNLDSHLLFIDNKTWEQV